MASTGSDLIARLAIQHPNVPPKRTLRSYLAQHRSLQATARALKVTRLSLRAALTDLGLWVDGGPVAPPSRERS